MSEKEQEHIRAVGDRWPLVLEATSRVVRSNPKLIGLDKIRRPLAEDAALKATGFELQIFKMPRGAGRPGVTDDTKNPTIDEIVREVFDNAVAAGEKAFVGELA